MHRIMKLFSNLESKLLETTKVSQPIGSIAIVVTYYLARGCN